VNATLFPVLGVALTFLLRSAAGSVAALLGLLLGPLALSPLLPQWWADHGQRFMPGSAMDALTLPELSDEALLGRAAAAVVVAAWLLVMLGGALVALNRRDV
jgi:ABC-2 type transport system permease protein